jgi:hypothetical protein
MRDGRQWENLVEQMGLLAKKTSHGRDACDRQARLAPVIDDKQDMKMASRREVRRVSAFG